MGQSFKLDGGDGDTLLTLVLLIVCGALSFVNFWIRIPPLAIFPAPIFAFLITRWGYKLHFRRRIDAIKVELASKTFS